MVSIRRLEWLVFFSILMAAPAGLLPETLAAPIPQESSQEVGAGASDTVPVWRIQPAAQPSPALKVRFWPAAEEMVAGNAYVPFQRAVMLLLQEASNKHPEEAAEGFMDKYSLWLEAVPADLPQEEVRAYLDRRKSVLAEMRRAKKMRYSGYDLGVEDLSGPEALELLLPEVQNMRELARLLVLEIRLAIAQGRTADAIDWLCIGFRLAEATGSSAEFLVTKLVAIAIEGMMLEQIPLLLSLPDAPNFYWALASLPPSIHDMTAAFQFESGVIQRVFPQLGSLPPAGTAPEVWREKLAALMRDFNGLDFNRTANQVSPELMSAGAVIALAESARSRLNKSGEFSPAEVQQMSAAEVVVRDAAREIRAGQDRWFKWTMLPEPLRSEYLQKDETAKSQQPDPLSVGSVLAGLMAPAASAANQAELRSRQRIAFLMTAEAIRDYVAEHGEFPESLAVVTRLPPWNDPLRSAPFGYERVDAQRARLSRAPQPHEQGDYVVLLQWDRDAATKVGQAPDGPSLRGAGRSVSADATKSTDAPVREEGSIPPGIVARDTLFVARIDRKQIELPVIFKALGAVGREPQIAAVQGVLQGVLLNLEDAGADVLWVTVPGRAITEGGVAIVIPCRDVEAVARIAEGIVQSLGGGGSGYEVHRAKNRVIVCPPAARELLHPPISGQSPGKGPANEDPRESREDLRRALAEENPLPHRAVFSLPDDLQADVIRLLPTRFFPNDSSGLNPQAFFGSMRSLKLFWSLPPAMEVHGEMMGTAGASMRGAEEELKKAFGLLPPELVAPRISVEENRLIVDLDLSQTITKLSLSLLAPMRESSQSAAASNTLKQIGLAMHNYYDAFKTLPPKAIVSPEGQPLLSSLVLLLPYLNAQELHQQLKLDEPWDSPHNRTLLGQTPAFIQGAQQGLSPGTTSIRLPVFPGSLWDGAGGPVKFGKVFDGTSNTIMAVLAPPSAAIPWTDPAEWVLSEDRLVEEIFGQRETALVLFCDGSVRTISRNIDPAVLKALLTMAGGEVIDWNAIK